MPHTMAVVTSMNKKVLGELLMDNLDKLIQKNHLSIEELAESCELPDILPASSIIDLWRPEAEPTLLKAIESGELITCDPPAERLSHYSWQRGVIIIDYFPSPLKDCFICRDDFGAWLKNNDVWPLESIYLIRNWWNTPISSLESTTKQRLAVFKAALNQIASETDSFDIFALPRGSKNLLKKICKERDPKNFSDATFDHFWKSDLRKEQCNLRDAEKYSPKKR